MMTSGQVVEMSVNVTANSPSQDYTHPDNHNLQTYNVVTVEKFLSILADNHYHSLLRGKMS